MNTSLYQEWIGRSETAEDVLDTGTATRLLGALDARPLCADAGALLLGHWLCFRPEMLRSNTGVDGHLAKGGFLPPVDLPRRMWASSQITWQRTIPLDTKLTKTSTIDKVTAKSGSSGKLVFVTVRHDVSDAMGTVLTEHQDIVYREAVTGQIQRVQPKAPPPEMAWTKPIRPDPVLLFRYSALTGNAHRIHYDRPYAQAEEGYPALVVHGPLTATLLLDHLVQRIGKAPRKFAFRGVSPLFDTDEITLGATPPLASVESNSSAPENDEPAKMQAVNQDGLVCMTATAHFA